MWLVLLLLYGQVVAGINGTANSTSNTTVVAAVSEDWAKLCGFSCAFNFGFTLLGADPRITGAVLEGIVLAVLLTLVGLLVASQRNCCCCIRPKGERYQPVVKNEDDLTA